MNKLIEYQTHWAQRCDLTNLTLRFLSEGWTIVYVIPLAPSPFQPQVWSSYPTSAIDVSNPIQTFTSNSPTFPDFSFEIVIAKYQEEPCPTCSHLNPERIDRVI